MAFLFIPHILFSIAAEGAVMYNGVNLHVFDSNNNLNVLNYEDLVELSFSYYNTILIEKKSIDRQVHLFSL